MAVSIKNLSRFKNQEYLRAGMHHRFLISRAKSLPAKAAVHLKSKPSFAQWNSYLELSNGTHVSTASFHHLARNILFYDVAYITNMTTRNFAKDKDPILEIQLHGIKEAHVSENEKLELELSRLRRKGAMKEIPIKTPEGIKNMDESKD